MASELANPVQISFLLSDFLSALIIFAGTIYFMGFLKNFGGERFRGPAATAGIGILLSAILHEFGEFICRSGIHGGFPTTLFGSVHIIVLGSIGSIVFFAGCYLLQKRYAEYLK